MTTDDQLRSRIRATRPDGPTPDIDLDQALEDSKTRGRRARKRRRAAMASGGALTASALLVGALSLAGTDDGDSVLIADAANDELDEPAVVLSSTGCGAVAPTPPSDDGSVIVGVAASPAESEILEFGELPFVWVGGSQTRFELVQSDQRTANTHIATLQSQHLPDGCSVQLTAHGPSAGARRAAVDAAIEQLVWPETNEPDPIVVSVVDPELLTCDQAMPVRSLALDDQFGPAVDGPAYDAITPVFPAPEDEQLVAHWGDGSSSIEIRFPGSGDAGAVSHPVPPAYDRAACNTVDVLANGDISGVMAAGLLTGVDPELIDTARRLELDIEISSTQIRNPDPLGAVGTATTVPGTDD